METHSPHLARKVLTRDFANLAQRVQPVINLSHTGRAMLQSTEASSSPGRANKANKDVELSGILGVTRRTIPLMDLMTLQVGIAYVHQHVVKDLLHKSGRIDRSLLLIVGLASGEAPRSKGARLQLRRHFRRRSAEIPGTGPRGEFSPLAARRFVEGGDEVASFDHRFPKMPDTLHCCARITIAVPFCSLHSSS